MSEFIADVAILAAAVAFLLTVFLIRRPGARKPVVRQWWKEPKP
jgi:hypothetical protein